MKCTGCGYDMPDNARFCRNCGKAAEENSQVAEVSEEVVSEDVVQQQAEDSVQEIAQIQQTEAGSAEIAEEKEALSHGADFLKPPADDLGSGEEDIPSGQDSDLAETETVAAEESDQKPFFTRFRLLIMILIAFVIACGVFAGIYFGTDLLDKPEETLGEISETENQTEDEISGCKICGADIDEGDEYCEECYSKYYCFMCEQVKENNEAGVCEDCLAKVCQQCLREETDLVDGLCKKCRNQSLKCKSCAADIDKGFYCEKCLSVFPKSDKCKKCSKALSDDKIFLIDGDGDVFCENCDTGKYCSECATILDKNDDDDVCYEHGGYWCPNCYEVLKEDEIAVRTTSGATYCKDCDTGKYCRVCKALLEKNDDDDVCINHGFWCPNHVEVLDESEIAIWTTDGVTYCEKCVTGTTCTECGAPIKEGKEKCENCEKK